MLGDPRKFDLQVRTLTTAAIALIVTVVAAVTVLRTGSIPTDLGGWGALIIGFYFGAHSSMNGAGARSRQDVQLAEAVSGNGSAPAAPAAPTGTA